MLTFFSRKHTQQQAAASDNPSKIFFTSDTHRIFINGVEYAAHIAPTAQEVKSALGVTNGTQKFLREDGTWAIVPLDGDTHVTQYTYHYDQTDGSLGGSNESYGVRDNENQHKFVTGVVTDQRGHIRSLTGTDIDAGDILTGTLSVARGGTGQTTLGGLKTALGIVWNDVAGHPTDLGDFTNTAGYKKTDQSVTAAAYHYTPTADQASEVNLKPSGESKIITSITRDSRGHIVDVNSENLTKSLVGLGNVTNHAQVKGLASGTTNGHVVVFGNDGYTIADSGFTLGKSVPADAVFTDTNTWRPITDSYNPAEPVSDAISLSQKGANNMYQSLQQFVSSSISGLASQMWVAWNYIPLSQKGAANGVATLDTNGLVPSTQLPSYVDDVIEIIGCYEYNGELYRPLENNKLKLNPTSSDFVAANKISPTGSPGTYYMAIDHNVQSNDPGIYHYVSGSSWTREQGENGKIYIESSTGKQYRFAVNSYIPSEVIASPGTLDNVLDGTTYKRVTQSQIDSWSGKVNRSGDTMTGNLTFAYEQASKYKIHRKSAGGGGWAYTPIQLIGGDDADFFHIGAYGENANAGFAFIGFNDYASVNNLRIYDNYASWGGYPLVHDGNIGSKHVASADSATTASHVTINYNNDTNNGFPLLWGSGNEVFATNGIYCNPNTDTIYTTGLFASGDIYGAWVNPNGANTSSPAADALPDVGGWKGLKIVNSVGTNNVGLPNEYAVGLWVSGYYSFGLAAYGGGDSSHLYWKNGPISTWRSILHSGNTYISSGKGYINEGEITYVNTAGSANTLDGNGETSYFRYRGTLDPSFVDLTDTNAGASGYINPYNGIYAIPRSGYSESLISFSGSGSAYGLDLRFNYSRGSTLAIRRRIDGAYISGAWENIITDVNIGNQSVASANTISGLARSDGNWSGIPTNLYTAAGFDDGYNGNMLLLSNHGGQMHCVVDGAFYQRIDSTGASRRVLDEYDLSHITWETANYATTARHLDCSLLDTNDDLNNISNGAYYYQNYDNPANNVSYNCALLQIEGRRGTDYHQLAFSANEDTIFFRRTADGHGGHWGAWKEIAFTNGTIANATNATNAGNADTVDGYHASSFLKTNGGVGEGQYTFKGDVSAPYDATHDWEADAPVMLQHATQFKVQRSSDTWSLTMGVKEGQGWLDCVALGIGYGDIFLNPAGQHVIVGNYGGMSSTLSRNNLDYKFIVFGSANATTLYENGNRVITEANIGSQNVNYAASAGSVAWSNVTGTSNVRTSSNTYIYNDTIWIGGSAITPYKAAQVSEEQETNSSWGKTYAESHRQSFVYNTSGREWAYWIGMRSSDVGYGTILRLSHDGLVQYAHKAGGGAGEGWSAWKNIITSDNIGSQSVNYATSAGSAPASDVYSWAKQSTKPSYTYDEVGAAARIVHSSMTTDIPTDLVDGIHVIHRPGIEYSCVLAMHDYNGAYFQIYHHPTDGYDENVYFRSNNTGGNWRTFIDSNNIGSQSVNYATSAGSAGSTPLVSSDSSVVYGRDSLQYCNFSGNNDSLTAASLCNPTNDWYYHIVMNHPNSNGYYGDFALCFHSDAFYYRRVTGGNADAWVRVIDSSNIGSQSVSHATTAGSATTAGTATSAATAASATNATYAEQISRDGGLIGLWRTNDTYKSGMYYSTPGNEAVVFGNKYSVTSWIFATTNPYIESDWQNLTPSLQIKDQCVAINKLISSGSSGSYNLDVNGSMNATSIYVSGTAVVTTNDSRLSDSRPASDVYSWAKEATKPSYSASEIRGAVRYDTSSQGLTETQKYNARINIGAAAKSDLHKDISTTASRCNENLKVGSYTYRVYEQLCYMDGNNYLNLSGKAVYIITAYGISYRGYCGAVNINWDSSNKKWKYAGYSLFDYIYVKFAYDPNASGSPSLSA